MAKEIHSATKTYISTVADSGIGQAGLSVGGALAETANRNALKLASHAVYASGASRDRLPSGFRNWLKGKEKLDAAKKKGQDAEEARKEREIKRRLIARGEVVEAPINSRPPSTEVSKTYTKHKLITNMGKEFEIVNHPTRGDLAQSESPKILRHRELSFESTPVIGRTQQISLSDSAANSKAPQTPVNSDISKNFDTLEDNQHHLRTPREISNSRGTLRVEASPYANSQEGAGFLIDEPTMSISGTRGYSTTTASTKGQSSIRRASLPHSRGEPARGETLRALVAENPIETSKNEEAEFVDEEIEQDGERHEDDRDDEYDFGIVGIFDEE